MDAAGASQAPKGHTHTQPWLVWDGKCSRVVLWVWTAWELCTCFPAPLPPSPMWGHAFFYFDPHDALDMLHVASGYWAASSLFPPTGLARWMWASYLCPLPCIHIWELPWGRRVPLGETWKGAGSSSKHSRVGDPTAVEAWKEVRAYLWET